MLSLLSIAIKQLLSEESSGWQASVASHKKSIPMDPFVWAASFPAVDLDVGDVCVVALARVVAGAAVVELTSLLVSVAAVVSKVLEGVGSDLTMGSLLATRDAV